VSWTLHEGDCAEMLAAMPDDSAAAFITDPPYGIAFRSNMRQASERFAAIVNDDAPCLDWIPDAFRIIRPGGCLVCFHRWDVADEFRYVMEASGFRVRSQLVWAKMGGGLGDLSAQFAPEHELAWFATKGDYAFPDGRPSSVLRAQKIPPEQMRHPTEKPVGLFHYLVRYLTREGDVVVDPFAGSGALLEAAHALERHGVGAEIEPEYCALIKSRMEHTQGVLW
jgi:DNA modification methylase